MTTKLVLHIGGFKSGSTAIQSTLASHAYSSPGRRILYPGLSPQEGEEKTRGQHGPLAETLFPNKPDHAAQAERFARVAGHIDSAGADIAVISAEKFEFADPRLLAAAIGTHLPQLSDNLQILLYIRPHAERVLAEFAERVKHGFFQGSLEDLHAATRDLTGPRQRGFFYHPRLSLWRQVFGDRFTVRPMIRAQLEQADVVADFFRQILGDDDFTLQPPPRSNSSPSLEDLCAVRAFHRACGSATPGALQEKTGVRLIEALNARPATDPPTRLALHRALAEEIAATYAEDARALDRDFFAGDPMQAALAAAPGRAVDQPQVLDAAAHLAPDRLRLLDAWAEAVVPLINGRSQGQSQDQSQDGPPAPPKRKPRKGAAKGAKAGRGRRAGRGNRADHSGM